MTTPLLSNTLGWIALDALPSTDYDPTLVLFALDPTQPPGQRNRKITAGTLIEAISGGADAQSIRSVPFPMLGPGPLLDGQDMVITLGQAGTLLANSGYAFIKHNPTAPNHFVFNTINAGVVINQGTITVGIDGTVSFPSFAEVVFAAGDSVELINQTPADTTLTSLCIGFLFQVT